MRALTAVRLLAAPVLVAGVAALPGSAQAGDTLAEVRQATVKFHSVEAAEQAGYGDNALPCFSSEDGGMGEHLINGSLLEDGGDLDARAPEALVYDVADDGKWRLVAVEYIVLFSDAPADGPAPQVLGQDLTRHPSLPLWKLHAWIWQGNPAGVFKDWNPALTSCPG